MRPLPACAHATQLIACDVINPAHMSVTFDSIGGLENIKQALVRRLALACLASEARC
jgi:hypothetical protein